ncbi:MAG: oligosaccharide flippase family protein, partial [Erysipelotrichaceae bacterium]|nr:oligosaccharide flippase family protein [Erysipelotrichaceae bacterium]
MKKQQSILKSTLQVSIFLFITKILGVAKQSIIATVCGANAETDAYFVATGVIIALCTVVFSSIAIPLLSIHTDRLVKEGRESSNQLINIALRLILPMSLIIALVFASCSSIIAKLLAPSYQGAQLQTLSLYIRMMSAMFVLICYSSIINVILETDKKFLPEKQQGFLQNLFVCIAALFFYRTFGMKALIASFLLAGFAQCINVTWHARHELKLLRHVQIDQQVYMQLVTLALPLLVGNAIYEINDIVDKQIATGLGSGNVSFLAYGASVNEIVTTLIISSISTVLFSHYATWIAEGKTEKVSDSLLKAIDTLIVVIMPVMVMCLICGDYIVTILFGRGNFGQAAVIATAGVVTGYALGFIFQAFRATCVRVYFAFKDSKTPMLYGLISVSANILLSLTLSRFMGVKGIAVA